LELSRRRAIHISVTKANHVSGNEFPGSLVEDNSMALQIKICGITRVQDALVAARAGADFLGYIFWEPSKRYIEPKAASHLIGEVRLQYPWVRHVGVFVDASAGAMNTVRDVADFDILQLHGHESPEVCSKLTGQGITVIKVLSLGDNAGMLDYRNYDVNYYMCDTHDAILKGGTGRQLDLSLVPEGLPLDKTFLAGGFNTANVGEAFEKIPAFGVDVSSAVEDLPGIKNHQRVQEFIAAAKAGLKKEICQEKASL
jgi:phosphoribosylanthranilate isomerase